MNYPAPTAAHGGVAAQLLNFAPVQPGQATNTLRRRQCTRQCRLLEHTECSGFTTRAESAEAHLYKHQIEGDCLGTFFLSLLTPTRVFFLSPAKKVYGEFQRPITADLAHCGSRSSSALREMESVHQV
jgi:hypothetical protein